MNKWRLFFYSLPVLISLVFFLNSPERKSGGDESVMDGPKGGSVQVTEAFKVKLSKEDKERIQLAKLHLKELFSSVAKGELEPLRKYLLNGGNPDQVLGEVGVSLLGAASYNGNLSAVKLLISSGANIEYVDQMGNTPLMLSLMQDKDKTVHKELISSSGELDRANLNGKDALFLAVQSFNYEALQSLLRFDLYGRASLEKAFMLSVEHQDRLQMELFIDAVSWVLEESYDHGQGPVYWACGNSKIKSLKFLLSKINSPSHKFKEELISFSRIKSLKCKNFFEMAS